MKKTAITFFLLMVGVNHIHAQEYPKKDVDLEILADRFYGFQDLDLNYQELYENMALLLTNKINLNKANSEELRFLNLLSESQIQNLINYRSENGPLLSEYELQSIPGFDLILIQKIIPFVTIENSSATTPFLKRIFEEENNYLILRYDRTIETKEGFDLPETSPAKFHGGENEMYMRFRSSKPGDFSIGFTIEKDAGEKIAWNPEQKIYGVDFYSFHFQLQNKRRLKNLIVGDYQTQFAQGLSLGGSFGYGKGSEAVMTVRRSNLGVLPYTSANETGYKRGAALTYEVAPFLQVTPFYSFAFRDATLVSNDNEDVFVSSFQTSGLHRNETELSKRHQIQEQNYGAVFNIRKGKIDAGAILSIIDFNIPFKQGSQPYDQFTFVGNSARNVGAFFNYTIHNITFFSEAGKTLGDGFGITAGLLGSIAPRLDVALHFRNYQRNFYSLYANAFAEASVPQNESGVYWGWKYTWNRKVNMAGYMDQFYFPWLRYRSYAPAEGHEWLLRFTYQPSKSTTLYLQAREEAKTRNIQSDQPNLYLTAQGIKRNYWVNCDYGLSQKLHLKTRAQFSTFDIGNTTTKGMTLVQDVSVDLGKLTLSCRYALFDTDDYDNRQYVYEKDVWLAYSLPAYSGTGVRNYVLCEYSINKKMSVWFRYARTRMANISEIGTGPETIHGNTKTDIRIQTRIRF